MQGLGCRVQGAGFRVYVFLDFRIQGYRVHGLGLRVYGFGLRVWGLEFVIWGSGFRV